MNKNIGGLAAFFNKNFLRLFTVVIICFLASGCKLEKQRILVIKPDIKTSKDAIVARAYPTKNYGRLEILHLISRIKNDSLIDDNRILIYFDLVKLSRFSKIDSAYFYLYPNGKKDFGITDFQVCRIVEPWSDERVNWNNQPKMDTINFLTVKGQNSEIANPYKIDVTNFIEGYVSNKTRNFGFLLKFCNEDSSGKRLNFYSGDAYITSKRPELQIFYRSYF
ncbi:MAG: DNRLRE domain-containing protein [Bacteroidota bacterium]|nr:DNRLRE domain-containing protein [Bacteroidota bacterium]